MLTFLFAMSVFLLLGTIVSAFLWTTTRSKSTTTPKFLFISIACAILAGLTFLFATKTNAWIERELKIAEQKCTTLSGQHALDNCHKVLENNAYKPAVQTRVDELLVSLGRGNEAIQFYSAKIQKNPDDPLPHAQLCHVYVSMKLKDEALQECQRTVDLGVSDSDACDIYIAMAAIYFDERKYDKAIELHRAAIQRNPGSFLAHRGLMFSFGIAGKNKEVLEEADKAIQVWPNEGTIYYLKAMALAGLNKKEESLENARKAVALGSKDPKVLWGAGDIFEHFDENEEALAAFQKAVQLAPNNDITLKSLGMLQNKLGYKQDALNSFSSYLKLNSTDKEEKAEIIKYVNTIRNELGQESLGQVAIETPFRLGNFNYTIQKIESRSRVGNQFSKHEAQEGATLVLVHYTIRNESNETKTIYADDFKLKDYKGRLFNNSTDASTAYMLSGGRKDFVLGEVQPGLKREMTAVFEVPLDAYSSSGLQLVVPEKGWGGNKEVIVSLN